MIDTNFDDNRDSMNNIVAGLSNGVPSDRLVLVAGHASAKGRASENLDLSEKRAHAVVTHLSGLDGVGGRLVPLAMGENPDRPILHRDSEREQKVMVTLCGDSGSVGDDADR